jgi:hypothetical protein
VRAVPGVGAEIVLTVDGELRRAYIARTGRRSCPARLRTRRATFEEKGWA